MDLSSATNFEGSKERFAREKEEETRQEQGEDVTLVLSGIPGGQIVKHRFKLGVTVAYVKAFVAEQHALAFSKLTLKLTGGRVLIDPLSLSDCPGFAPGKEVAVEVAVAS